MPNKSIIFETIKVRHINNSPKDIIISSKEYLLKIQKFIDRIHPDIFVFLGDRYETFISAYCAFINRCKIVHLHGGELTFSLYDDALRHSITKFANLHFVSHINYKKRIIQLGESSKRVFNVGAFGVENIINRKTNVKLVNKFTNFNIKNSNFILVCYHPETLKGDQTIEDFKILINSLKKFKNYKIIFNIPNNDAYSKSFIKIILKKIKLNNNFSLLTSLGSNNFFTLMESSSLFIGNSSSGILESPYLKTYFLLVGDRQKGRVLSPNIFSTKINRNDIENSIEKIINLKLIKKFIKLLVMERLQKTYLKIKKNHSQS